MIGNGIYFDTDGTDMADFRLATSGAGAEISDNPWIIENTSGDILYIILHMILWSLVLVIIELGLQKTLNEIYTSCFKNKFPREEESIHMLREEKRPERADVLR